MKPPKVLINNTRWKKYNVSVLIGDYYNGGKAIMLRDSDDGQPVATLTVWLDKIPENNIALDINNAGIGVIDWLQEQGIITKERTKVIDSGYCSYPVYPLEEKYHETIPKI